MKLARRENMLLPEEVAELRAENTALKARAEAAEAGERFQCGESRRFEKERDALASQVAALRTTLSRSPHHEGCDMYRRLKDGEQSQCDCLVGAALADTSQAAEAHTDAVRKAALLEAAVMCERLAGVQLFSEIDVSMPARQVPMFIADELRKLAEAKKETP